MTHITAYLTFYGACRETMEFYKECLSGELNFQTVGDSPLLGKMPDHMKSSIMHTTLTKDEIIIMASDMLGDEGLIKGNIVLLMLHCNSEDEIRDRYRLLSRQGQMTHPTEITFLGALFGGLTDKYSYRWLLHYPLTN